METQKQAPPRAISWIPIGGAAMLEHPNGEKSEVIIERVNIQIFTAGEFINFALKDGDGDFYFLLTKQIAPNLFAAYKNNGHPTGATLQISQVQ